MARSNPLAEFASGHSMWLFVPDQRYAAASWSAGSISCDVSGKGAIGRKKPTPFSRSPPGTHAPPLSSLGRVVHPWLRMIPACVLSAESSYGIGSPPESGSEASVRSTNVRASASLTLPSYAVALRTSRDAAEVLFELGHCLNCWSTYQRARSQGDPFCAVV